MQCPEWMTGWGQGWSINIHWLWAIPFVFVVAGALCMLFLLWRIGPRYMMHPLSGWHLPNMPHMPQLSFGHETAQQILDRRYASGEITQAQHAEMKLYLLRAEGEGVKREA